MRIRRLTATLALLALTAGCRTVPEPVGSAEATAGPDHPADSRYPLVKPVILLPGRVVAVNSGLRFVVLEYGLNPLPLPGTELQVFRANTVVGKLRVSGPTMGSQTIADILEGEAQPGDQAVYLPPSLETLTPAGPVATNLIPPIFPETP